jgi:hypothetical protein
MSQLRVTHNINRVTDINTDLPAQLKEYEGELPQSLVRFKTYSNIHHLDQFPNFQYGWLVPPSGWVAQMESKNLFKQYPFMSEKYRTITAVEINTEDMPFTTEQLKEIESTIRLCFPRQSNICLQDTPWDGWCPGIGENGCMIGIYETKVPVENKDELKHIYYLVCHTSLPEFLIDELQEHERMVQRSCDEYEFTNGTVRQEYLSKAPPNTLEEEFKEAGVQYSALELAKELGIRNIVHFAQLTGLKLVTPIVELLREDGAAQGELVPFEYQAEIQGALLPDALKLWPPQAVMCPFSELPRDDRIPAPLRGYKIGLATQMAMKVTKDLHVKFDATIYTLQRSPALIQTVYNTFKLQAGQLCFYSNTTPISDWNAQSIIMQRGLELGFSLYNYDPIQQQPHETTPIKNEFGSGFPVQFPFRAEKRDVPTSTIQKFFTWTEGGTMFTHRIPVQLQGRFINSTLSQQVVETLLPIQNTLPIQLTPVLCLLSPSLPPGPIYSYDKTLI